MTSQEFIIETQCGYFCEPVELKIIDGNKVYRGYVDVPQAIATVYPDRASALRAIERFDICKKDRGIVASGKCALRMPRMHLHESTQRQVISWKKGS